MFRIDSESKKFLKKLGEPWSFIKTDQEFGYLCFLYGLAKGVSIDLENADTDETARTYVTEINPIKYLIAGMIGLSNLKRRGEAFDDEKILNREFQKLLDNDNPQKISKSAVAEVNRITFAGFRELSEDMPRPDHMTFFLTEYLRLLRNAFQDNW